MIWTLPSKPCGPRVLLLTVELQKLVNQIGRLPSQLRKLPEGTMAALGGLVEGTLWVALPAQTPFLEP